MSGVTAVPAPARSPVHPLNRPNITSVGTIVWLASELMFFAGLFAMFFSIRAAAPEQWAEHMPTLDVWYALPFTIILVSSSITCQIAVFRAEHGDVHAMRRWFSITFLMGLVFVLGQVFEYGQLMSHGVRLDADGFGSMYYLTTGFHLLHVIGGLFAFVILMIRSTMGRFTPAQATSAIVVSYYWHFVDAVWIALFAMIYLLPVPVVS
jgi:cytochrome c oxidase subunit III